MAKQYIFWNVIQKIFIKWRVTKGFQTNKRSTNNKERASSDNINIRN